MAIPQIDENKANLLQPIANESTLKVTDSTVQVLKQTDDTSDKVVNVATYGFLGSASTAAVSDVTKLCLAGKLGLAGKVGAFAAVTFPISVAACVCCSAVILGVVAYNNS